ncbi:MAG: tRNA pseudouridine(55) synthase TruB [Clostridia bacterium]|nr:tRNA pseudouridine(55) synthase TruB [Clostridia bacterium]
MDGVFNLLKPPGMSSSNLVYDLRRLLDEKRAGHLGTLDPGAAGVLPVCVGRATRLFDYLVDKEKAYIFEMRFGFATDTLDAYGRVTARGGAVPSREALRAALPAFIGEQSQTAPLYSALKVGGRKMYDLARAGAAVEPPTRRITVGALELLEQTGPGSFLLSLRCSRGTYVRSLAADIAASLGGMAYVSVLLRAASGAFTLESAHTLAELAALRDAGRIGEALTDCETALMHLPALELGAARRRAAMNGLDTAVPGRPDGDVRLYADGFLGVGRVKSGSARLSVHLYGEAG